MKYYVVSDIHGYYDELILALSEKGYFDDKSEHKLVILGDFMDRGRQAKQMQEFLLDRINSNDTILIKGNHEDLIVEFINNLEKYEKNIKDSHHYRNSTVDTVSQLTGLSIDEIFENKEETRRLMNSTSLFQKIIPNCLDYYETKHYIFVHGYIPVFAHEYGLDHIYDYNPNWRIATNKEWYYARWYNGIDCNKCNVMEPNKIIVCGHWHASYGHCYIDKTSKEFGELADFSPYYHDGIIAIDGCVPRTKKINCIIVEDEELDNVYSEFNGLPFAAKALHDNNLVIMPTETVFGICGLYNDVCKNKMYEAKRRSLSKQLPIVVNSISMIKKYCDVSRKQANMLKKLLPNPLTVILKLKGSDDTIAIRYSKNKFINDLIASLDSPLYLSSANISGQDPITSAFEARVIFKDSVAVYIDGLVEIGIASTIIDLTTPDLKIVRVGKIKESDIKKMLKGERYE